MRQDKNTSEIQEEIDLLRELNEKKRQENEPSRWDYVLTTLRQKGYTPEEDTENKCIRFLFKGNTVTVWPYTGWFSGKGVKDGRGTKKLFKQI